jgi:hypothetical protein
LPFEEAIEVGPLKCRGCGKLVWPRVGGYWFLLLSPRGRCRFPGVEELKAVLCSFCGRRVREAMELAGVGIEGCFERIEKDESGSVGSGVRGDAGEAFDRGVVRE